jgi:hypothetical protein
VSTWFDGKKDEKGAFRFLYSLFIFMEQHGTLVLYDSPRDLKFAMTLREICGSLSMTNPVSTY